MAYQVLIFGYDANNRLDPVLIAAGNGNMPSTVLAACNPCHNTRLIIISPTPVTGIPPAAGYAAGPNEVATDTKELYVLEFVSRDEGWAWMTANKDALVGKTIHTVDSALG